MVPFSVFSTSRRGASYVWQPVFFCGLFFSIACGAMYYLLDLTATRSNQDAAEASEHLAQTALKVLADEMEGQVVDYALWDVTVDQVENGVDPEWAEKNVGSYLADTFGYSGSFLTAADGTVLVEYRVDESLPSEPAGLLGPNLEAFLAAVQASSMAETEPVSRYVRHRDKVVLVTAGAVTREDPTEEQRVRVPRPVLYLFTELDADVLSRIARDYRLDRVGLALDPPDGLGVPLPGVGGNPVAALVWDQRRPGDDLIHQTLPILLVVALVLFAVSSLIFTLWIRAAVTASTAKSQILAKMSHEFRTPLNPIIGFSEIMMLQAVGPIPDRYRDYAEDIHRSGKHLQRLVEELLDLSKIEAGKLVLQDEVLNVPEIVEAVTRMAASNRPGTGDTKVQITSHMARDLPNLKADELRVRQILINLVSNATKFSEGRPIAIRADTAEGGVRIEVEDQGVGIPRSDLERVLRPFEQSIADAPEAGQKGTGLGLTISRELMRLHGGTLELESEVGKGTCVRLTFPPNRSIAA